MKKINTKSANAVKTVLISVLIAAIALLALPFGLFARSAKSPVLAEENDGDKLVSSSRNDAETPGNVEVTVNYYRPNEDYGNWEMWLWVVDGVDGAAYQFDADKTVTTAKTGTKKWKTLTKTFSGVKDSGDAIGFIVRTPNWDKDPDGDRFIDASEIVDGKVTIWVVSGDSTFYYREEEIFMPVFKSAVFNSESTVFITTSKEITNKSVLKVKEADSGTVIGTLDCTADGATAVGKDNATITLNQGVKIDFSKNYVVVDEPAGALDGEKNFGKPLTVNKNPLFDTEEFTDAYAYDGTLGVEYTAEKSKFTVWAPFASKMVLNIYDTGDIANEVTATTYDMTAGTKGEWTTEVTGNLAGKYYTYSVTNGSKTTEVVDPYAKSAGQNGKRGMIVDFASAAATPDGWADQKNPELKSNSNAVIYEAHLRDLTISPTSGVSEQNRGKFLGLTETGTKVNGKADGSSTGLDYLKSLGVTQVHFQPLFDFASVNEYTGKATYQESYTKGNGQFNWGYDPQNYNVPEGSYSSDPTNGYTRVKEMRAMVEALHNNGIQVVMDVVYNHVADAKGSNFEALAPGYYFRTNNAGVYTNGSGCGNETASERYMFRRFMIDSVKHWAQEYKIDGFRFDLMGLHDTETMNEIAKELKKINPDVIIYGEGWTGGTSGLDGTLYKPAILENASETPDIAYFNDIVRDKLKGGVFDIKETGFVSAMKNTDGAIYVGAAGGIANSDVGYTGLGKTAFASNPTQNINYVSAHDNSTLWDKLNASVNADAATLKAMNRMAAAAVLTGQGASFFLAGEEMLRSKPTTANKVTNKDGTYYYEDKDYDGRPQEWLTDTSYIFSDNSYKSTDKTNAINWELINTNREMVDFYRELIAIKKTFPQFQIQKKADINKCLTIVDQDRMDGVTSYAMKDPSSDEYVVVLFNNNAEAKKVVVPDSSYDIYVNGDKANAAKAVETFTGSEFTVGARSAVIMKAHLDEAKITKWQETVKKNSDNDKDDKKTNLGLALGLGIGIPALVLIAGGTVFGVMYSKKKKGKTADKSEDAKSEKPEEPETDEKEEKDEAPEVEKSEEPEESSGEDKSEKDE